MSAHILFYGTYPLLLDTHVLILKRSGFTVARAESLQSFRSHLDRDNVDLCIFCSSLDAEDRDQALAILSILQPEMPYMVLSPSVATAAGRARKPMVNCLAGPEFLLERVRESLPVGVA